MSLPCKHIYCPGYQEYGPGNKLPAHDCPLRAHTAALLVPDMKAWSPFLYFTLGQDSYYYPRNTLVTGSGTYASA